MWPDWLPSSLYVNDALMGACVLAAGVGWLAGTICYLRGWHGGWQECQDCNGEEDARRGDRSRRLLDDVLDDETLYLRLRNNRHRRFEAACGHPWNEVGQDNLALDVRGGGL